MKKRTNTESALFASMVSMLLCMIMLVGTTLAWFQDSSVANISVIQIGHLSIEMQNSSGRPLANGDLKFTKSADINAFADFLEPSPYILDQEVYWEPGYIYELPEIYVVNNGEIPLRWKLFFKGLSVNPVENQTVLSVLDAIDLTVEVYKADCDQNGINTCGDFIGQMTVDRSGNLISATPQDQNAVDVSDNVLQPNGRVMFKVKGSIKEGANGYQGYSFDNMQIVVSATQINGEFADDSQYPKTYLTALIPGQDTMGMPSTEPDSGRSDDADNNTDDSAESYNEDFEDDENVVMPSEDDIIGGDDADNDEIVDMPE